MSKRRYRHLAVAVQAGLMLGALGMFTPVWANPTLPTGGISNTAIITEMGNAMTVDGQSARNVIAWDTFSIGKNNSVTFTGKNAYLNYVTGSSLSEIYGSILGDKADVYLFNPNGIIFGETANINVGSLYASTKKLKEEDLLAFEQGGTMPLNDIPYGNVVNNMTTALGNMTITLEGNTVTFSNTKLNDKGKLAAPGTVNYIVKDGTLNIGYETESSQPEAKDLANIEVKGSSINYLKLISSLDEMQHGDPKGRYMLAGKTDPTSVYDAPAAEIETGTYSCGYFTASPFKGILDGAGHTVNLNTGTNKAGHPLFKELGANIINLTLTGTINVEDTNGGDVYLGALAGKMTGGFINSVYNKASVTYTNNSNESMSAYVGGLLGKAEHIDIWNSGNSGNVTAKSKPGNEVHFHVGGLVGRLFDKNGMAIVYNQGNVENSSGNSYVGGLVGSNNGNLQIVESYNAGNIDGGYAGGLIGEDLGDNDNGRYTQVFNTGAVKGKIYAGGLIGWAKSPSIENAYSTGSVANASYTDGMVGNLETQGTEYSGTIKRSYSTVGNTTYWWDRNGKKGTLGQEETLADFSNIFYDPIWSADSNGQPLLKFFLTPLLVTDKRAQADDKTHYIYNTINNASGETDNLSNTGEWSVTEPGLHQAKLVNKGGQFGYYFINEKPYLSLYAASADPATETVTKEIGGQTVNLDYMLPTGGISDTAYFGTKEDGGTKWLTVNGTRENNIIAWDSFSIGRKAGVEFLNPEAYKDASWNYLNYVTGKNLSEIYGKIEGHKNNIFLLNPNGIIFGEEASINVGSLYASTRQVTEQDLLAFENLKAGESWAPTGDRVGDVVNRMGSDLSGKKITLEGDNVSFSNSVLNNGNLTIGGGGDYTVKADTVTIGFEGKENREAVEGVATESNLDTTATRRYAELIGQKDLNRITEDPTGTYMLKENVGGQALTEGIFSGTLDGAGHTVALAGESFFGGNGLKGAKVRNLTLTGSVSVVDGNMGALVGTAIDSKIANVFNEAEVKADYAYSAGGLVGKFENGSMKNSANRAEVSVKNNNKVWGTYVGGYVGGVTGSALNDSFERVYNTGKVSAANESYAGGLIGVINDNMDEATSINNSYNEGDVAGGVSGGLVAQVVASFDKNNDPMTVSFSNVFNSGNVTAIPSDDAERNSLAGGLVSVVKRGTASFENAYNVGAVEGEAGYVHGIGSEGEFGGLKGSISSKNVYNAGTVKGEPAYAYWDAEGNLVKEGITDQKSLADALNGEGSTFTSSENWVKTGTDTLPLLKAYMNPLHITDKTVTYDGGTHYLYYTQEGSPSAHLTNTGAQSGRNAGTYKATLTSDQLGYYMVQTKEGDPAKDNPAVANQPVLTIKPADLTFTVTVPEGGYSRVYDGTNKAEGATVTMTGTVYGTDKVVTSGTVAFEDANANDNKVLKISGVEISDGNGGNNYNLVLVDGNGTITRAPLTLVADPVEVTQGAKATFTGKITGFVNNEGLAEGDKLVFTADTSAAAREEKYPITGTLNGKTEGNYGNNYTFENDLANKNALTIIAKSTDSGSGGSGASGTGGSGASGTGGSGTGGTGTTGGTTSGNTGSTSTPASTSTPVTETATVPQQATQQVAQPQTANTANATAASTAQTANEAAKSLGQASHQEAASTEDAEGDKALSDAGSKGALDISSPVQHTQLDPEQIKKIVDESGADISSKAGDEVNTEHFEYGDFNDGNVGKVEH